MKYIILAGRSETDPPKQLLKVDGEVIIERTIKLLKRNGARDIQVSSMNPLFDKYGRLEYDSSGDWVNAFPKVEEPVTYIFGDVFFSLAAIKTIVETKTESIEFFASAPPFSECYPKEWAEPFAFKVVDTEFFQKCIKEVKRLKREGAFKREPIAWELWQVIKGTPLNEFDYTNYTAINDYTCDVDHEEDVKQWIF